MTNVKGPVIVNQCCKKSGHAPQCDAGDNERLSWEAVAEPSRHGRGEHVHKEQAGGESAHLLVRGVKFPLYESKFARQDVPVNETEQVDAHQQR